MKMHSITIIAAVAQNGVIGNNGRIPWHIPSDLKRFKRLTMGRSVVMGRRTYESLPSSKLPGRDIIVLTKGGGIDRPNLRFVDSFDAALALPRTSCHLLVAGGSAVYREALVRHASRMYITRVHARPEGDTFFPDFSGDWCLIETPTTEKHPDDEFKTTFETWVRHD